MLEWVIAPSYLADLLVPYVPSWNLRSAYKSDLVVKSVKLKSAGNRAFEYCAPLLWNQLPKELKLCETFSSFKTVLKTYLFKIAYNIM